MKLFMLLSAWFLIVNIYSLQFQTIDGTTKQMNLYGGKKILLVNIATGSSRVNQLAGLQQLQQLYPDSLVIVGFPSNSFGNESRTDAQIKQFCQSTYGVSFQLAQKAPIAGPTIQPIYNWLTSQTENGVTGTPIKGDFQKMLIDEAGNLIGIFSPAVDPLSNELRNAISN